MKVFFQRERNFQSMKKTTKTVRIHTIYLNDKDKQ